VTKRREFSPTTKRKRWDHAKGRCERCGVRIDTYKRRHHYDHDTACELGGDNSFANCRLLCEPCHVLKTGEVDRPAIAKAHRRQIANIGAKAPPARPLKGRGFANSGRKQRGKLAKALPPKNLYEPKEKA